MHINAPTMLLVTFSLIFCVHPRIDNAYGEVPRGDGVSDLQPEALLLPGHVDEVLHGEHALDLLLLRDGSTSREALVFLYTSQCEADVSRLLTSDVRRHLPAATELALIRHDYESRKELLWFDASQGQYNIREFTQGHPDQCSCLMHIPKGSKGPFERPCQPVPPSQKEMLAFAWQRMTFRIVVVNKYAEAVKVTFQGKGPTLQEMFLPMGTSAEVWAFPDYYARVYSLETDDFLGGWHIDSRDMKVLEIHVEASKEMQENAETWEAAKQIQKLHTLKRLHNIRESHARRHWLILKQPQIVANFTETGYLKTRIPVDLYTQLLNIYKTEQNNLYREYYPDYYTIWNLDEIDIHQVTLPETLAAIFAEQLRPMMEGFCDCKLKRTAGTGIVTRLRRYPHGARVRMHVDELESGHVIGAILHLTRDLADGQDWPLELFDFSGTKQTILMIPGDMVIFEASRLPHGRPEVFKGKYYVNTFFYYKPWDSWAEKPENSCKIKTAEGDIPKGKWEL